MKVSVLYGSTDTTLVAASVYGANDARYAVTNTELSIPNENGKKLGPNEVLLLFYFKLCPL